MISWSASSLYFAYVGQRPGKRGGWGLWSNKEGGGWGGARVGILGVIDIGDDNDVAVDTDYVDVEAVVSR